jgi:hypothetical protein
VVSDVEKRNRAGLADMAMHLANQLASDMETLADIKARWDANGRCQAEDLLEHQRAHPIPDPDHKLYIATSGLAGYQDSLDTELSQSIDVATYFLSRLHTVNRLAAP